MTTLNFNTACTPCKGQILLRGKLSLLWRSCTLPLMQTHKFTHWKFNLLQSLDILDILLTIEQSIVLSFHYECKVWLQPIPSGQTSELPEVPNCQRSAETAPRLWREWNKFPRKKTSLFSFESFLMLIRPVSLFQKPLRREGGPGVRMGKESWNWNGQVFVKVTHRSMQLTKLYQIHYNCCRE